MRLNHESEKQLGICGRGSRTLMEKKDTTIIQTSISMKIFKGKCRREEVVISRLRLGHTGLKSTLFI